ncbi:MAG TPA: hypothetical protein VGM29_12595 [Polyangiaceae bacterium]|jgi:hypothetical protein
MPHREEQTFTIDLHVVAEFPDDYAGDEDGLVWHEEFQRILKPRLVAAVFQALETDPRFKAKAAPRGRDPERALELELTFTPAVTRDRKPQPG